MTDESHDLTMRLLSQYLSPFTNGPWTIEGACVTARSVVSYRWPADAAVYRVLIEHPPEHWSVAVEAAVRGHAVWDCRVERFFDDEDAYGGSDQIQPVYLDWLRTL